LISTTPLAFEDTERIEVTERFDPPTRQSLERRGSNPDLRPTGSTG
jgi:hypothetical protein